MEDFHALSINKPLNLASRVTATEAQAFIRDFIITVDYEERTAQIQYCHRNTQRNYRVTATLFEANKDPTRDWLQSLVDLFPWATLEEDEEELSGRLLGLSGRVDGLQGCDLGKDVDMIGSRSPKAADDLALVSCHPNGGFGELGKLPKELRCEVYKYAFPHTFWQCYHTKRSGIALLGMTHSSRLPAILNASKVIREEALESAYSDRNLSIIIGTEVIAFNFPLLPSLQAGQSLDGTRARLLKSTELFVGVQIPSPRSPVDAAMVRDNIGRIVALLNNIAPNQTPPPIRVSFKTNQETRNLQYYTSDFGAVLRPLAGLRTGERSPDIKPKKPLVIDRLPPYDSGDDRDRFCDGIERSIRGPVQRLRRFSF